MVQGHQHSSSFLQPCKSVAQLAKLRAEIPVFIKRGIYTHWPYRPISALSGSGRRNDVHLRTKSAFYGPLESHILICIVTVPFKDF